MEDSRRSGEQAGTPVSEMRSRRPGHGKCVQSIGPHPDSKGKKSKCRRVLSHKETGSDFGSERSLWLERRAGGRAGESQQNDEEAVLSDQWFPHMTELRLIS